MGNKTIALKNAVPEYLEHLKKNGKSESTLYTYGRDGEQAMEFFCKEKKLDAIRATDIGRFLKSEALLKKPNGTQRADASVQKTVRFFRMMLEWAHEKKYIKTLTFPKSAMPKKALKEDANANTQSN